MKRHEKGSDIGTFQNKNTGKIKSLKIEPVLFLVPFIAFDNHETCKKLITLNDFRA